MIYGIIKRLEALTPKPIKTILKVFRSEKVLQIPFVKYAAELEFQKKQAKEFVQNRAALLEYWKQYRYLDEIEKNCAITENSKILDVGCGLCTILHYVKGKRFGIDPLAEEYSKLYHYPEGIHIIRALGENIPFPQEYFDVIFCSNALDHVTTPRETINEIYRTLKMNGYLVLTVEVFDEQISRDPAHPHSFTRNDVYALLKDQFEPALEKESPWIGIRNYVIGSRRAYNKELVLILKKVKFNSCGVHAR